MASMVVTRADIFPSGTVVKAFPRAGYHTGSSQSGKPSGTEAGHETMAGSPPTATIEGLVAGTAYMLYAEVGGVDKYLLQSVDPQVPTGIQTGVATPSVHKLVGMTFDPVMASGTPQILTTAGTLHMGKIFIPQEATISKIVMWLTTKAETLTALENGLGIFAEGTRQLLGQVAIPELITAWQGTNGSEVSLPLTTPVVVGAGYVWYGAYFKGTKAPTFAMGPSGTLANIGGLATTTSRYATGDTGLTTALPATVTSSMVAEATPLWAGVA